MFKVGDLVIWDSASGPIRGIVEDIHGIKAYLGYPVTVQLEDRNMRYTFTDEGFHNKNKSEKSKIRKLTKLEQVLK